MKNKLTERNVPYTSLSIHQFFAGELCAKDIFRRIMDHRFGWTKRWLLLPMTGNIRYPMQETLQGVNSHDTFLSVGMCLSLDAGSSEHWFILPRLFAHSGSLPTNIVPLPDSGCLYWAVILCHSFCPDLSHLRQPFSFTAGPLSHSNQHGPPSDKISNTKGPRYSIEFYILRMSELIICRKAASKHQTTASPSKKPTFTSNTTVS